MELRYRLKDLKEGQIYRDTLSGQLVLVSGTSSSLHATAKWWNPAKGEHEYINICDLQLESAEYPSHYLPRPNPTTF